MRMSDWSSTWCSYDLRLQPFENMQRQTPVRRHRPDFARAVFFSGNWHPPGRPDWRCNRAACADNVIVMTARKDFEAVAPMHTPPDGVSFHALHFAESLQLDTDPELGRAASRERGCQYG